MTANHALELLSPIAEDVEKGLTRVPKSLPPKLFYDAHGSALFEKITELPEYYLTRTERNILLSHADDMVDSAGKELTVIELGSGSALKTHVLLEALLRHQPYIKFVPIDISSSALRECTVTVSRLFPRVSVNPVVADYTRDMSAIRSISGQKLVLYLGSSIGNFEPMQAGAILNRLRSVLEPGDSLLLGTDLAKSASVLVPAYDDSQGVTASFNKNILGRINRELDGRFNLASFNHIAEWSKKCSRMEIYLESTVDQSVPIRALGLNVPFCRGERVHTENSYKFTRRMLDSIFTMGGFTREKTWYDDRKWFALTLARVE